MRDFLNRTSDPAKQDGGQAAPYWRYFWGYSGWYFLAGYLFEVLLLINSFCNFNQAGLCLALTLPPTPLPSLTCPP
jgi:hypothetical protein